MDTSTFTNKSSIPSDLDLQESLGKTFHLWKTIEEYVHFKYPGVKEEWHYPGEKYGWGYRLKDPKRVLVYLLPRENCFKIAFVFGQKATMTIMDSNISAEIKKELSDAKVYAEGRGIRIEIKDDAIIEDIKLLIDIKIAN
jgi:hypothetical protein